MFKKIRFHFDNIHFNEPLRFPPYLVMQTGDLASLDNFECVEHEQRVHELTYIVDGETVITMNGERVVARTGDVIFNPKGSMHAIECENQHSVRYYYIGFEISDVSGDTERELSRFFEAMPPRVAVADKSLKHSFHDLFANILNRDEFSDVLSADSVRRLLVSAVRSFRGGEQWYYLPDLGNGKNVLLSQICSYIDSSEDDINALKKIPEQFGYSYSYLSGLFSSAMHISLREYFLRRRFERGCELLREGASVTAVSEQMGYSSVHSFSHAFAQRAGMSPSNYRKEHRLS